MIQSSHATSEKDRILTVFAGLASAVISVMASTMASTVGSKNFPTWSLEGRYCIRAKTHENTLLTPAG